MIIKIQRLLGLAPIPRAKIISILEINNYFRKKIRTNYSKSVRFFLASHCSFMSHILSFSLFQFQDLAPSLY
jgi:hypothetical protein